MNTVIYARYSSDNQREESITAQLRAAHAYCEKKGYNVIREYTDEACTAKNDNRPNFQQMIADAKKRMFSRVVFHKIDRNSRNAYDYYFYKRMLKSFGVSVEYVEQSIDDSPEGLMMESVLVGMAEYYSNNLAREIKKGKKETAYNGQFNGGTPPLGYDIKNKSYVINEQESLIVRFMFERYADGIGLKKLVQELNSLGYLTKRKKPFGINSIHEILANKKYCGTLVFGTTTTDINGKRNTHAKHDNAIEIENVIPPIVSKELWKRIEKIRLANAKGGGTGKAKEPYLLSGVARCSCGSAMVGTSSSARGIRYKYYICSSRERHQDCKATKVRKDDIEQKVINDMYSNILNPENLPKLTDKINSSLKDLAKRYQDEHKHLQKEKLTLEANIERMLNLAEMGGNAKQLAERINSYQARLDVVEMSLKEVYHTAKQVLLTEDKVLAMVANFADKAKSPEHVRAVIKAIISSVVISEDEYLVTYRFKYSIGAVGATPIVYEIQIVLSRG